MRSPLVLLLLILSLAAQAQDKNVHKPKLVVGIVVDQMRYDYLYRYYSKYGQGGFRRLMGEGFVLRNAHYNYVPTVTGPGHASVYTGTTPAVHGIIGNDWWDKNTKKSVNCVDDDRHKPVGNDKGRGNVSPWRMLSTTVTDELELSTQQRSKVIGVSFKDRGAVLPTGHQPDGAYWYDRGSGGFITSTYYMKKLPPWVEAFNQKKLADQYLGQVWKTLLPIEQYTESGPDDSPYESKLAGKDKPVFPYDLNELKKKNGNYDLLSQTPFGNDLITAFALAAIDGEKMGNDEWTDFLAISYSPTDALGHAMGPNAVEIEDMYLRLDLNMESLLKALDEKIGTGNYTLFLTADHGVAEVAQSLKDKAIPAGYFSTNNLKANLNDFLGRYFPGKTIVEEIDDNQIYLNHTAFQQDPKASGVEMMVATELIANYLETVEGIATSFPESTLRLSDYNEGGIKGMVVRGHHFKRSGDIAMVLEPGWLVWGKIQGSSHGSPYSYDTHVPVLFFGWGVKAGSTTHYHSITDIAPTVSTLLNIRFPNGCTGQPISELFGE